MPKTVCQSVAWFKRYKTLKSVTVGSLNLRKFSYSAKTRSAFGLARNHIYDTITLTSVLQIRTPASGKSVKSSELLSNFTDRSVYFLQIRPDLKNCDRPRVVDLIQLRR